MSSPLEFPFPQLPAPGSALEVAPGVHWARMPLPFELDHINLWLLEDEEGWTAVDSGIGNAATRTHWEQLFAGALGGRPLKRVIVTHYHPDHAGNAQWLCQRFGCELWMTRAEYLTVHAVRGGFANYSPRATVDLFRANGLDEEGCAALLTRGDLYRSLVPDFPLAHRRLLDGGAVAIGGRDWRVISGYGHAPEHASLYCEQLGVLISGDMLLPRISTNVAVRPIDPRGNPLKMFLDSVARYRALPEGVLVLPSHGAPFRGAHARIAALEAHHEDRLADLEEACGRAPHTAADALEILFRRKLGRGQIFFAMGEAIAHLHHLHYAKRARREVGADGVARFSA
jgi:glyoxylase-like metal-dependent hydrolase (beta-lactamase superfamily II)